MRAVAHFASAHFFTSSGNLLAMMRVEPTEPWARRRETRLTRILEAKRALEERAREQAKKDEPEEKAKPKAKMQYNFTDPESRARGVGHDLSHAQHSEVTPALLWIEENKKGHS